jgi:hypothetical protein
VIILAPLAEQKKAAQIAREVLPVREANAPRLRMQDNDAVANRATAISGEQLE